MKLSIVIFNFNYSHFLAKLFSSLNYAFNHKQINIFFCDDGSNDDSLLFVQQFVKNNNIINFTIISVSEIEEKRVYPSGGQLEGIKKIVDEYGNRLNAYISFIDADDWFGNSSIEKMLDEMSKSDYKFYFNDLRDSDSYVDLPLIKQPIKRSINKLERKIWPTIVPTSGIVIKKEVLLDNIDKITSGDVIFSDVWLDSRINMLAINDKNAVKYTDIIVYRFIHGQNDSLKFNFKRVLNKQIQASKYYNYIVNSKFKFDLRKKLLELIHG